MITKLLIRLETTGVRLVNTRKLLKSSKLKVSTSRISLPVHSYIVFKHYTGNEILYTLKDCNKLRPGELSSAILELGLRKGTPEGYDWNKHPCVIGVLELVKEKIPQYTSRVLTSLALGFSRLEITDQTIWELLAKHVIRTITSIDSVGLAFCFSCFTKKNFKEFYEELVKILPVHLGYMTAKDFMNIVNGICEENIEDLTVFKEHLYPFIKDKKNEFTVSQVQRFLKLCEDKNIPEGLKTDLESWIEENLSSKKIISFGGTAKKPSKSLLDPPK